MSRDVEQLVERVLNEVVPPESLPAEMRSQPWLVCMAMYVRARGLLKSILALSRAGRVDDGAEILARSVFELVATSMWVFEDLNARSIAVVMAGNRDLRQLAEEDPWYERRYQQALERWREAFDDAPSEQPLPPLKQRLTGPIRTWYPRYRLFSTRAHPGIVGIDLVMHATKDGSLSLHEDALDPRLRGVALPFSAIMVWGLSMQLASRVGGSPPDSYRELGRLLNDHLLALAGESRE